MFSLLLQFIWKAPPPEMRMPPVAPGQRFSIVVDDMSHQRGSQDIVVLRKPGSFRGSHQRHGRRHASGNESVMVSSAMFCQH